MPAEAGMGCKSERGDFYEKSDLDLLVLINDAKGWQLINAGNSGKEKWEEVLSELDPEETYKNTVNLYHYIDSNKEHIDYSCYLEMGLFIGSGAIESCNKIIVQRRFKQAGMRWGVSTAQYLMTLVSKWESELWESDIVNRTYEILN